MHFATMGFDDAVAYARRRIDRILRPHRHFARAYVDGVFVHSDGLDRQIKDLDEVFEAMDRYNIRLAPTKSSVGFLNVIKHRLTKR